MSNECLSLTQKRKAGSSVKKAVLMYMADKASDDGSGIWTSKAHIAADCEITKRSVQRAVSDLLFDGLIEEVGKKKCQNGHTIEYRVVKEAIRNLPSTREKEADQGVTQSHPCQGVTSRGDTESPQGVTQSHPNHPLTILKPSDTSEDLFGDLSEAEKPDPIDSGFDVFWSEIWPSHSRKAGKADCAKLYRQICEGKFKKHAHAVLPDQLNNAAKAYVSQERANQDLQYLKGPKPWLNQPGWEPFLSSSGQPEKSIDPFMNRINSRYSEERT